MLTANEEMKLKMLIVQFSIFFSTQKGKIY